MRNIRDTADTKNYRGYIRPEPRCPAEKQRGVIAGLGSFTVYEEAAKEPDGFPMRTALVKGLRAGDVVVVSDLHRLAPDAEALRPIVKTIKAKGATILEAVSGFCSAEAMDVMIFNAVAYYQTKGLTTAQASAMGKLGAAASPAAKPMSRRMPIRDAQIIWRDPQYTVEEALAVINADKRYRDKYTMATAYRWLKQRAVTPGRRPKQRIA